jgi:hypothetical protein
MVLVLQTLQKTKHLFIVTNCGPRIGIFIFLFFVSFSLAAQKDTARQNSLDSLLSRPKGLIGQLTQSLLTDTVKIDEKNLQRNDVPYLKYENYIIRNIVIQSLEFGTLTKDTVKRLDKRLARFANNIHYKTRRWVVHNNLFFRENDKLSPYLLGNNERYLRDLPYLREARILVWPVRGTDSVDVIVVTKDVLSIGGKLNLRNSKSATVEVREDNLLGWGDQMEFQALYDGKRRLPFGYGAEYIKRNIGGSFIDGSIGFLNFDKTFNSRKREERVDFVQFIKPLVNPYMLWTYAFNAEKHSSDNMFNTDSVFESDLRYKYDLYDAWAGLNLSTKMISNDNEFHRLRYLLSARVVDQKFSEKPLLYANKYYYPYADLFAILGAVSVFRLNYYKTQFIYGFGRNEDLPEGLDASFTAGWTRKQERERPYAGFNLQHYYFTKQKSYFNYSLSAGSYLYKKKLEDISIFANVDFFSPLMQFGKKWKQRSFLNASFGKQFNSLLDEPFLLESHYGLPDFKYNSIGGSMRANLKAENVFFSPWSILYFKFAPFIFGSATAFKINGDSSKTKIFPAFGGGIRTRNESLIFGTVELRAVFFPKPDLYNHRFLLQFNTNLRFKYIQNFIRRPEFVRVN